MRRRPVSGRSRRDHGGGRRSSIHQAAVVTSSTVSPWWRRSSDCHGVTSTDGGSREAIHIAGAVQNPQSPS
ncbi:MAG: hypothetical protein R2695_11700 [Acidimicrobiales bacterium]